MSTSPGKDPGNIAPPVDSREPCPCGDTDRPGHPIGMWCGQGRTRYREQNGADPGASRPTALDAATDECVCCIACHKCVGACDCTGGPRTEPDCTCYELTGGHQPGCYYNRKRSVSKAEGVKNSESPPPAGPVCASCKPWCGGPRKDVPPDGVPIGYRDEQVFCSTPCIRAGRPLHPEVAGKGG